MTGDKAKQGTFYIITIFTVNSRILNFYCGVFSDAQYYKVHIISTILYGLLFDILNSLEMWGFSDIDDNIMLVTLWWRQFKVIIKTSKNDHIVESDGLNTFNHTPWIKSWITAFLKALNKALDNIALFLLTKDFADKNRPNQASMWTTDQNLSCWWTEMDGGRRWTVHLMDGFVRRTIENIQMWTAVEVGQMEEVHMWRPGSKIYKKCFSIITCLNKKWVKLINNILLANHDKNCICTKVILNLRKILQSYFLEIKIPNDWKCARLW